MPSIIILNTSNEQYFVPAEPVEDLEQLLHFFSSVLDGSAPVPSAYTHTHALLNDHVSLDRTDTHSLVVTAE